MLTDWRMWLVLGAAGYAGYRAWQAAQSVAEETAPARTAPGATTVTAGGGAADGGGSQTTKTPQVGQRTQNINDPIADDEELAKVDNAVTEESAGSDGNAEPLNEYGDPQGTVYAGGNPNFDETGGGGVHEFPTRLA